MLGTACLPVYMSLTWHEHAQVNEGQRADGKDLGLKRWSETTAWTEPVPWVGVQGGYH